MITIGQSARSNLCLAFALLLCGSLTALAGNLNIRRSVVFHEITRFTTHQLTGDGRPAFSDDGSTIAYSRLGRWEGDTFNRVFTVGFESHEIKEVDRWEPPFGGRIWLDLLADGSAVVASDQSIIRFAHTDQTEGTLILDAGWIVGLRIARQLTNPEPRVFFLLKEQVNASLPNIPLPGGLYVMGPRPGLPQPIVTTTGVAAYLGVDPGTVWFGDYAPSNVALDVSRDGQRLVFIVHAGGLAHIFRVHADGTGLLRLRGDAPQYDFNSVAISGNGSTVAYCRAWPGEFGMMDFWGANHRIVVGQAESGVPRTDGDEYLRLTEDGSRLLLGGWLAHPDEPRFEPVSVSGGIWSGFGPLIGDGFSRGLMDAWGSRFVYSWRDASGFWQISNAEINAPLNGAPELSDPSMEPPFVIPNGSSATIQVQVATSNTLNIVNYATLLTEGDRAKLKDTTMTGSWLVDNGSAGDVTPSDGRFTRNAVMAQANAALGPRLIRLNAECTDGAGFRHGVALELEPFTVVDNAAPRLVSIAPQEGPCGLYVVLSGELFGLAPDTNGVIFTGEFATGIAPIHGATQQELSILVPYGLPPGPYSVTVTTRGRTSNPVRFTVTGTTGCIFTLSTNRLDVPIAGGSRQVAVTTQTDCPWAAQSHAPWMWVEPPAGTNRSGSVTITVAANPGAHPRQGTLTVAGQTVTVVQAGGFSGCAFDVAPTTFNVGASSTTNTVQVTTEAGCAWTAQANSAWITIRSGAAGSGNGAVEFAVAANAGATARQGTLTVAGQVVTVNQQAGSGQCTYDLFPTELFVPWVGITGTIQVDTQPGCAWAAQANEAWIVIESGASGTGDGMIEYSLAHNPTTSARQGTITVEDQTVTFYQEEGEVTCVFEVTPTAFNVSAAGGTNTVQVTTQPGCAWTAQSSFAWITVLSGSSGVGSGTVEFAVAANPGIDLREGGLTVAGHGVTVNQAGRPIHGPPFSIYHAVELRWLSEVGKRYQIHRTIGIDIPFTPWGPPIEGTGDFISVFDRAHETPAVFYELELLP